MEATPGAIVERPTTEATQAAIAERQATAHLMGEGPAIALRGVRPAMAAGAVLPAAADIPPSAEVEAVTPAVEAVLIRVAEVATPAAIARSQVCTPGSELYPK